MEIYAEFRKIGGNLGTGVYGLTVLKMCKYTLSNFAQITKLNY